MSESLRAGLYPVALGTHQVFANLRVDPDQPLAMPRPGAVVVIGLGEEGRLRTSDLIVSRAPGHAGLCAARHRAARRRRGRLRAGGHAGRQRRRRHPRGHLGAGRRAGRGRGQPAPARQRLAGGDAAAPGRAVPGPRDRGAARAVQRWRSRGRRSTRWRSTIDSGIGAAAPAGRLGLPRHRLRLHHRRAAPGRASAAVDRVHARHAARAQRGARPVARRRAWSTSWCASAPTPTTATRRSGAACSSCWCRWRSSRSWPAPVRWCCSWTATPRASRGRCSTATTSAARGEHVPWAVRTQLAAQAAHAGVPLAAGGRRARGRRAGDRRAAERQDPLRRAAGRARGGAAGGQGAGHAGADRRRMRCRWSTRCWPSRCASCTSPATASSAKTARAAWCCPTTACSARTRCARCAACPSWCSSTAASSAASMRRATARAARWAPTARASPPAWPSS